MLLLVEVYAQGHSGAPHWEPRWPVFLINFPLINSYSPKPNHYTRVRRHLSDLVSINSHIQLTNQLWWCYFRDQIFPRWFYLKGFLLFLEPWDLMETDTLFHTAEFPNVMSQGTGLGDSFTFLPEDLRFSSPVVNFYTPAPLGRDSIDQMIKGSIVPFP